MAPAKEADAIERDEWYWDDRTRKLLAPYRVDESTVAVVSVWHREEAESALEAETLVPLAEREGTREILEDADSFRRLDDETLERLRRAHDDA